jgi:class 3 adenylate cyclase
MDLRTEVKRLREELKQSEHLQSELDRRVFYLKTLYDVSKDIFSSVETETILRSFLLMGMGSFGATEGAILLINSLSKEIQYLVTVGLADKDVVGIKKDITQRIGQGMLLQPAARAEKILQADFLSTPLAFARDFGVESEWTGIFGLGAKLIGEPYNQNDRELLDTLVNNLIVSLKNARSFEKIKGLNRDLESKNLALAKALKELQAAMRKVEILESIKLNLCKFVPTAVTKMVENSPTAEVQEAREQDISVLFLDIEGYTKITECVGGTRVNTLIEKYFSVFMDAIYENNGDVVETAGDGLMVLFLSEDEATHALEAVRAAQAIKEKACIINDDCSLDSQPLVVNIGICSGQAFVGAAKFESYTGSRWAYTSHGTTINVAARLCGHAKGGAVLVAKSTADRVNRHYSFSPLGKFALKNLSGKVDIFALQD